MNQALVGRGRVDRGQCWAGASFHWWPCWAAVCRIGRRASSVPTSSRSATGSSSGRVDDGRHHCFIVPCVHVYPVFHVHDLHLTFHLVKSVMVKMQFCVASSGIYCLHCLAKIIYSILFKPGTAFTPKCVNSPVERLLCCAMRYSNPKSSGSSSTSL